MKAAEIALLRSVFRSHPEIREVRLFGSRAKRSNAAYSDVDLVLYGDITPIEAQRIAGELDELPLPYRYDVIAFASVKSHELREHIERVGVRLYPASDLKANEAEGPTVAEIEHDLERLKQGTISFWELTREIEREHLRALITMGLQETNGSYKSLAQMFHIPDQEYRRFMDCIRRRDCRVDFRPFRRLTLQRH